MRVTAPAARAAKYTQWNKVGVEFALRPFLHRRQRTQAVRDDGSKNTSCFGGGEGGGARQHEFSLKDKEMDVALGSGDKAMNLILVKIPKPASQSVMGWNGNLNCTKKQQSISRVSFIYK